MDGHAFGPAAAAPSVRSSELLGFPADARVLIINLDDFGMYHAINAAVLVADLQECDDDGAALVYGQHLYNSYDCRYNDGTGQWDLYVTPWP